MRFQISDTLFLVGQASSLSALGRWDAWLPRNDRQDACPTNGAGNTLPNFPKRAPSHNLGVRHHDRRADR